MSVRDGIGARRDATDELADALDDLPGSFDEAFRLRQTFLRQIGIIGGGGNAPPASPPGAPPPPSGPRIGRIIIAPDYQGTARYTGAVLGRAPLRELGATTAATVNELVGTRRVAEIQFGVGVGLQHRRADFLQNLVNRTREGVQQAEQTPPRNEHDATARRSQQARGTPTQEIDAFARGFTWDVVVPGNHYSGLTNEELRDILARQGRDFFEDTPELRAHVGRRLRDVFSRGEWDVQQAATVAADAIREWIVRRVEDQGVDVTLEPLNAKYRAHKIAEGYDGRIGIRTGAWFGKVKHAEVHVHA